MCDTPNYVILGSVQPLPLIFHRRREWPLAVTPDDIMKRDKQTSFYTRLLTKRTGD